MKKLFESILLVMLDLALAACGNEEATNSDNTIDTDGSNERTTQVVNYVTAQEASGLDSVFISVINISSYIGHIQDGFYWEDENNEIKSALTEDLSEISEDGLTHPIKMREDVQWENRDLNTADDFVIAVWTLSF